MSVAEFGNLRTEIEENFQAFARTFPALKELMVVKEKLNRLQSIADALESPAPPRPTFSDRPVLTPPPALPEVPQSERYRQISIETRANIKRLLREQKTGRDSKAVRRELARLEAERTKKLQRVLQEDAPSGFFQERERLKKEHKAFRKEEKRLLAEWEDNKDRLLRGWQRSMAVWRRENETSEVRQHAIRRLKVEWERFRSGKNILDIPVGRVPWQFLPPPEPGESGLQHMLTEIRRHCPHLNLDLARVRFAYELGPSAIYIGLGEFDGYLAFTFVNTKKVLLECPLAGNAAYIFNEDWKALSQRTKTDLLAHYGSSVGRVIHDESGYWKGQLRRCFVNVPA